MDAEYILDQSQSYPKYRIRTTYEALEIKQVIHRPDNFLLIFDLEYPSISLDRDLIRSTHHPPQRGDWYVKNTEGRISILDPIRFNELFIGVDGAPEIKKTGRTAKFRAQKAELEKLRTDLNQRD